jgi:hypothetical protein
MPCPALESSVRSCSIWTLAGLTSPFFAPSASLCAAFVVTAHVPVPRQPAPLHPVNVDPEAGAAVRVTVPLANVAEQAVPQLIPAGLLVTLPVHDPLPVTESGKG